MSKEEEILNNFNFEKVHSIMVLTNHTYRGEEKSPDIDTLKSTAFWCVSQVLHSDKESCTASTGGFIAVKIYNEVTLYYYAVSSRIGLR